MPTADGKRARTGCSAKVGAASRNTTTEESKDGQGIPESERHPTYYTNYYTNPARNLPRATNNKRTQGMGVFALSIGMRSTNGTPPRTPMNNRYPRWQRGGQGFDPPRLHPYAIRYYPVEGHASRVCPVAGDTVS